MKLDLKPYKALIPGPFEAAIGFVIAMLWIAIMVVIYDEPAEMTPPPPDQITEEMIEVPAEVMASAETSPNTSTTPQPYVNSMSPQKEVNVNPNPETPAVIVVPNDPELPKAPEQTCNEGEKKNALDIYRATIKESSTIHGQRLDAIQDQYPEESPESRTEAHQRAIDDEIAQYTEETNNARETAENMLVMASCEVTEDLFVGDDFTVTVPTLTG